MGHTIADFRNLLNQIEQISETIAKEYDVEHLAGPQGWALRFIAERTVGSRNLCKRYRSGIKDFQIGCQQSGQENGEKWLYPSPSL
ncbi:transcriptional regulator [Streptococcus suis]|nr:transcriptional regulator [Streptococcus suis]